jgi:hypothetical protein
MRLYAHWLDGEYVRIVRSRSPQIVTDVINPALKISALFGNEIVLSDIQLYDSGAVQDLFLDSSFRQFLQDDPSFLWLVASAESDSRFTLATSGAQRARSRGWKSSSLDNPSPLVELAEILVERKIADPYPVLYEPFDGKAPLIDRWPQEQYRRVLKATTQAIYHFSSDGSKAPAYRSLRTGPVKSFYEILYAMAVDQRLAPGHRNYVEDSLDFIDRNFDGSDRYRRSLVKAELDRQRPPNKDAIWNTIVQAWNCAVHDTLSPEGGSIGFLPDSAPLGIYLEEPTSTLVTVEDGGLISSMVGSKGVVTRLNWDVRRLDWGHVRHAVERTRDKTRLDFQRALAHGATEERRQAFEAHVEALKKHVPLKPRDPFTPLIWAIGSVGAVVFGKWELVPLTVAVSQAADLTALEVIRRLRRFRVANTLREAESLVLSQSSHIVDRG